MRHFFKVCEQPAKFHTLFHLVNASCRGRSYLTNVLNIDSVAHLDCWYWATWRTGISRSVRSRPRNARTLMRYFAYYNVYQLNKMVFCFIDLYIFTFWLLSIPTHSNSLALEKFKMNLKEHREMFITNENTSQTRKYSSKYASISVHLFRTFDATDRNRYVNLVEVN